MEYVLSKQFEKDFSKLPKPVKAKVVLAFEKFVKDEEDHSLHNHALAGKWNNHHSINVTGDIRAVYVYADTEIIRFVAIGSRSKLYG